MKPFVWIVTLAAATLLGAVACRSGGGGLAAAVSRPTSASTDTSRIDSLDATVRIENTRFPDMVVYILTQGGIRQRIGMANGNSTTVLTVPRSIVLSGSDVRFILRPIGGGNEESSDRIFVSPGDEVVLTLTP